MPTEPDRKLHYVMEGADDAPVLVMSNSLGTTLEMWEPQMAAVKSHFRVLRYDTRGHGRSPLPSPSLSSSPSASSSSPAPFTMQDLAEDVLAIMDHAGVDKAHFCGLSMGGMTGIWLARHHAARFGRFVLANTAALIGPASVWNTRIDTVRRDGMPAIVNGVLARWFTGHYLQSRPDAIAPVRKMLEAANAEGYVANCAAVRDADLRALLSEIHAEVLVIAGEHDMATTPAQGRAVAEGIAGAHYLSVEAAHLSNWELPEVFGDAVTSFLSLR